MHWNRKTWVTLILQLASNMVLNKHLLFSWHLQFDVLLMKSKLRGIEFTIPTCFLLETVDLMWQVFAVLLSKVKLVSWQKDTCENAFLLCVFYYGTVFKLSLSDNKKKNEIDRKCELKILQRKMSLCLTTTCSTNSNYCLIFQFT